MWVPARDTLCSSLGTLREGCFPFCTGEKSPAPSDPHPTQGCCRLKSWPRRDRGVKLLLRCFCGTGRVNVLLLSSLLSKNELKSVFYEQDRKARRLYPDIQGLQKPLDQPLAISGYDRSKSEVLTPCCTQQFAVHFLC